jgi:hypothetical protein
VAKDSSRQHKHQDGQVSVAELLAKHRAQIPNKVTGRPVRRAHAVNAAAGMVGDYPTAELYVRDLLRREGRRGGIARPATGRARRAVGAIAVTAGATVLSAAILAGAAVIVGGKQQGAQAAKDLIIGEQALQPNAIGAAVRGTQWSRTTAIAVTAVTTRQASVNGSTPTADSTDNHSGRPEQSTGSANGQRSVPTGGNPTPRNPTSDGPSADGSTAMAPDPSADTTTSTQPPTAGQSTTPDATQAGRSGALEAITGVADTFFATAPTDPTTAFSLLAPEMQTGGLREFKVSWQGVRTATVEKVVPDGNHAARISVLYAWEDGRRVRTEQRLVVSRGVEPHIKDATVLSVRGG